ncbi:GntR family transcriptional regulator [Phenylobacterium sp. Root77]|uniref:aminotransferase-like domain-containing protein n=1 Tax=unclassified Phenylobacterium TaxID=2640670 RepID=UPI0006F72C59|nr:MULTISPECIES: PLP-dependent aminotransferase family protein [unclassified Phenylobacterium]KQW70388.1 GntR family transcriptional regulator [Phenylobacterium sp. Root1277]KQW91191.1 GntR family transcriptional regulator [Phenylobacterium sp. Root1290]KRC39172.1 GntR family transcriptional regulator [Phenylobacterium sp. Root77]
MTTQSTDWAQRFSDRMSRVRANEIRELLKLLDQPDILSFAGGIPDPGLFPAERIQAGYDAILADPDLSRQALQYSVSEGYLPLREWIAERMAAHGVPCGPDNIMLTAGSQQALDLLGKLFISPGDTVMVARPTYLGALQAFTAYEPSYLDLPEDALSGDCDAQALMAGRAPRPLGYFVPDYANPTGESLPLAQREALLDLADRLDMTLIEDAAYRELRFAGEIHPSLLALDVARSGSIEQARTLFCGTFSKTISPALRLGWVCGPRAVIEKLVLLKQGSDLHVSTINQMVGWRTVTEDYEQHLSRLRNAYGAKAQATLDALDRHMPQGVTWSKPEGGMFVWLRLPDGMDGKHLLERAIAEERVAFVPGEPFFAEVPSTNAIRLSYSLPTAAEIDDGVARLAQLIARQI